jgi:hypothetical protein
MSWWQGSTGRLAREGATRAANDVSLAPETLEWGVIRCRAATLGLRKAHNGTHPWRWRRRRWLQRELRDFEVAAEIYLAARLHCADNEVDTVSKSHSDS